MATVVSYLCRWFAADEGEILEWPFTLLPAGVALAKFSSTKRLSGYYQRFLESLLDHSRLNSRYWHPVTVQPMVAAVWQIAGSGEPLAPRLPTGASIWHCPAAAAVQ